MFVYRWTLAGMAVVHDSCCRSISSGKLIFWPGRESACFFDWVLAPTVKQVLGFWCRGGPIPGAEFTQGAGNKEVTRDH